MTVSRILSLISLTVFTPNLANAQSTSICPSLLKYGVYDESQTFGAADRFRQVRSAMCTGSEMTFSKAQSAQANFSIPIIDALTAKFGGSTTSENFETRKQSFCTQDLDISSASQQSIESVRKISTAITDSFVKCVQAEADSRQPGIYAYIRTSPIYEAFSIEIDYKINSSNPGPYSITAINSVPKVVQCDVSPPVAISAKTHTITCQKPAEQTVLVSLLTTQGAMPATTVPGQPSTIGVLQASVTELQQKLSQVSSVPRGTVAAFNLPVCPDTWTSFDVAAGRTVIGAGTGAGLTERKLLSTGGAETHVLTVDEMPAHTHPGNVGTGGASFEHHQSNGRIPSTSWQPQTGPTGGNKPHDIMNPYIVLRYCQKN